MEPPQLDRNSIESNILSKLNESLICCELMFSVFSSSLNCYRRASICTPFPDHLKHGRECDFEEAIRCVEQLPSFHSLLNDATQFAGLSMKQLQMLHFILHPPLFSLQEENMDEYLKSHYVDSNCKPSYVFKIVHKEKSNKARKFNSLCEQYKNKDYAFHGTALENVHSILYSGLTNRFSKDQSLFGSGIYLALDIRVSENFLSLGQTGWKNSTFGNDKLGCIFGCEVVDNGSGVKYVGADQHTNLPTSNPTAKTKKSYILAENEECVQTQHLLLFRVAGSASQSSSKCVYMLVFYLVLLLFVALLKA